MSGFAIAAGALGGAIAGSFLSTLVLRWPAGRSIAHGRSRCDGCDAVLAARDLVPVLSYLLRRGRCRRCGGAIDPLHVQVELAMAAIGAVALAFAPGAAGAAGALLGWLLLALALLDARHFWLPDLLTLPLLLLGLAGGAAGIAPPLGDRLGGAIAGFAALALIAIVYRCVRGRVGIGGGDPKLLAAIGAWLGWRALPMVVLGAALLGLGWVMLAAARGRPMGGSDRLPFGVLLAAAAWIGWMWMARG